MDEKIALEELQFIRRVIEESKRKIVYNGIDYIFWGIITIVGMMLQYILILNQVYFHYIWIWAVLISIGWILSLYSSRKHRKKMPQTYPGKIVSSVWLSLGLCMTLIGFLGPVSHAYSPMAISPLIAVIIGAGYFITGRVVESKWFTGLSLGWWIGAVIMFYVANYNQFLIMALLMLFFQTIPGIMVYRNYQQKMQEES